MVLQGQVSTALLPLHKHQSTQIQAVTHRQNQLRSSQHQLCTCISWMMALNWVDLSIQMFTSSIARSKFFTYSPYIFRKGASFCRISPIRGLVVLWYNKKLNESSSWEGQAEEENRPPTTLPFVSAELAAGTADENSRWSKYWRRFPEPHHWERMSGTEPPLGVGHKKPAEHGGLSQNRHLPSLAGNVDRFSWQQDSNT